MGQHQAESHLHNRGLRRRREEGVENVYEEIKAMEFRNQCLCAGYVHFQWVFIVSRPFQPTELENVL